MKASPAPSKVSPSVGSFNHETLVLYAQQYLAKASDLFLRNLQALREMKSSPITIKIEQAGQVNVGEKQLNIADEGSPRGRVARETASGENPLS